MECWPRRATARGLADAYNVLVDVAATGRAARGGKAATPMAKCSKDPAKRSRGGLRPGIPELRVEFVLRKVEAISPEERRVVLQLLWKLPEVPQPFATVLARWTKDEDRQVAEQASRLLRD